MQEGELVAAIAAGDPGGIAEAYDRYAGSLYAYCLFRLTSPGAAAEAVLDTFAVATVKLPALRDPQRLGPWLHAVARNECLRRLEPSSGTFPATGPMPVTRPGPPPGGTGVGAEAEADEFTVGPPAELRSQVLAVCTDPSPRGQAHRAALAERAGVFGPTGFPTAAASSGPRWWRPIRRHPRIAAAVAASALAVAAGITALTAGSGSGQPRIITMTLGDGDTRTTADNGGHPSPAGSPGVSPPAVPTRTAPGGAPSPARTASGTAPQPTARVSAAPAPGIPSASASASAAASASASAAQGYLMVSPTKLVLTGASGEAASGTFVITALNGPVGQYTVTVPKALAGQVSVSPSSGSLPADNWVTVTVTVTSKIAIDTQVTVSPGSIPVTVLLSITA